MSGVQKFVVDRAKSSQHVASEADPGRNQRLSGLMDQMGMSSSSAKSKIGSNTEAERRPSSRQAVADRSRVSTPVFKPQNVGNSRHALQGSHAPFETALATRATGIDGRSNQRHPHPESKTLGAFDTDTEKLDETTSLDTSVDFTVKSEAAPEGTGLSRGHFLVPRTCQVHPDSRSEISSHAPASLASEDSAETNADHDGDDEYNDPSQYVDFDPDGRRDPVNFRHEGAAIALNGKGRTNEVALHQEQFSRVLDQSSFPPNIPPYFVKSDHESQSQNYPHYISSTGPPSESADETKSEMESAGPLGSPGPNKHSMTRHVKAEAPADPRMSNAGLRTGDSYDGVAVTKRKRSPRSGSQKPKQDNRSPDGLSHLPNKQNGYNSPPKSNPDGCIPSAKPQKDLDYEPKALANMNYQQLADESFDKPPHPIQIDDPPLTNGSPLKDKLLYLHRLTGPRENIQSQRQAFFSSLPLTHYEECGDLMADQFSQIIITFKEARQQKRRLAKEFEDEIAAREKVVESKKVAVTNDLSRLKRAGQDVVRR
ncbi:MAG: hypothetical protein Q9188_005791 [Gyalolechia gomerana]